MRVGNTFGVGNVLVTLSVIFDRKVTSRKFRTERQISSSV